MTERKIYISCDKEMLECYQHEARQIYREAAVIVNTVEQAELVLAIYPLMQEMEEDIKKAESANIPVIYMTRRFIPKRLYDDILDNRSIVGR